MSYALHLNSPIVYCEEQTEIYFVNLRTIVIELFRQLNLYKMALFHEPVALIHKSN